MVCECLRVGILKENLYTFSLIDRIHHILLTRRQKRAEPVTFRARPRWLYDRCTRTPCPETSLAFPSTHRSLRSTMEFDTDYDAGEPTLRCSRCHGCWQNLSPKALSQSLIRPHLKWRCQTNVSPEGASSYAHHQQPKHLDAL